MYVSEGAHFPLTPPQEVTLQDELRFFTLEAITDVFFGDYATPELFDEVKRFLPVISWGLVGLPVRCPWPLNKLPVFGFGKAMDAREAFKTTILRILGERRAERASTDAGGRDGRSAGILDSLIELQQKQMGRKDGQEDMFDDDFIVDNVRVVRLHLFNPSLSPALACNVSLDARNLVKPRPYFMETEMPPLFHPFPLRSGDHQLVCRHRHHFGDTHACFAASRNC